MAERLDAALRSTLPKPWEQAATFEELLLEQIRKAPWLLLSIAVHATLLAILAIFPWGVFRAEKSGEIFARIEPAAVDPFREMPEEPPPQVQEEKIVEEPILQDAVVVPEEVEAAPAEIDFREAPMAPFEGTAFNDVIGIGGGAGGGKYGGRFRRGGRPPGGTATAEALRLALEWLKDHQDPDGGWSAADFSKNCRTNLCDGAGIALHDVGTTGLALLAFLGDGNTTRHGKYREAVVRGLQWLLVQQDPDIGLFGTKSDEAYLYRHAIATLALAEAYNLTRSPSFRRPLERAVALIHEARNPYLAWRYHHPPDGDNDTSVTGWMIFALKAAEDAGVPIERAAYDGARAWFERVTETTGPDRGRVGYTERGQPSARRFEDAERFPASETESLTAVALLCRVFMGDAPGEVPMLHVYAKRLAAKPPRWEATPRRSLVDAYYWYYGTFAMWQMGGEYWRVWERALQKAVLDTQRKDGDEKGSWDPVGVWGRDGGRVYMTAICALCLEVYYRYGKLLGVR